MEYGNKFVLALLRTISIEVPLLVLFIYYFGSTPRVKTPFRIALIGVIASALTLPYLWFVLPLYFANNFWFAFVGEILVIVVEATIYKQLLNLDWLRAIGASLVANALSLLLGLVL